MFQLRDYILKLIDESLGKEPNYKIRENALKWYERGVLVEADLQAVDTLLEEAQEETSSVEEIQEENEENYDENQESAE